MEARMDEVQKEKAKKQYTEGLEYIYPQKRKEWAECVKRHLKGEFHGEDIDCALKYMASLSKDEDLWAEYEKSDAYKIPNDFFSSVLSVVTMFAKRGVEFYFWVSEHRYARIIGGNEEKRLISLAIQNEKFKHELAEGDFQSEVCIIS